MGLLGHMVVLVLVFEGTSILFSIVAAPKVSYSFIVFFINPLMTFYHFKRVSFIIYPMIILSEVLGVLLLIFALFVNSCFLWIFFHVFCNFSLLVNL